MSFSYDRVNGTPQKKEQLAVAKISSSINRKLMTKLLNFVNRL